MDKTKEQQVSNRHHWLYRKRIFECEGDGDFTTWKAFYGRGRKYVLPATVQGSIICEYTCRCNQTYVGKMSQLLGKMVNQHVPDRLFFNLDGRAVKVSPGDSAITKHLSDADECVDSIASCRSRFNILAKARNSQPLDVLEAPYIRSKSPVLCQQKRKCSCVKTYIICRCFCF